jgi:hypothetical protein
VKTESDIQEFSAEEVPPQGYKEVPWPESGRFVFGPWCLLGAWPAVFGVMEKIEEPKREEP